MAIATNAGAISVDMVLNSKAFEKKVRSVLASTQKATSNSMNKTDSAFKVGMGRIGGYIATAFSVTVLYNFTKSAVNYASEVQAAWSGLNSIVQGTGNSFAEAQKFLKKYTADGLVSISDATTAYKNLLARGYTTEQVEMTMERLKDAATFGRQASYSLSGAVVSATEGLKNENSVLVDNAGVTKNVAKMWEDYAKSIGTTANNLTKQQKIQAEVLGIQEETKFQVGDSAVYLDTYAGKVAQLSSAFSDLKLAWGQVVTPIIELFIPAITKAIQAITAFINKIKTLLATFGIEMKEYVSKDNGIATVGKQANETASNITSTGEAAQKAAKKIKGAFNSVDEINVLKTKDDSGASSGAGASDPNKGESTETITPTVNNSVLDAGLQQTRDKLLKFIEPLKAIDFTNIITAFNNLKEAIKPFGETIGKGLEWLYFNVLVPLAGWTIEDFLPSFLNLLAGAFKVLNPLLESFGRVFEPVWNNLLKPILSWTGGAIVGILNGIADALTSIGNWMSENESTVDAIVTALLTFFGLWKVTQLLAFIQTAGGITSALKLMTSGIWSNIAAKIADKAETVALTLMYAGDFLKSLGKNTLELGKQVLQWGALALAKTKDALLTAGATVKTIALTAATTAWNVAGAIATGVTTAFGAAVAFLTSPIGLVVIAITALIAIIVLLVKNWDTVKEVGAKAWEGIKKAWSVSVEWFKGVVNSIKKAFEPVVNWFKTLFTNALNGIKTAWSGVTKWASGVWSNIKSGFSAVGSWFKTTFTNAWNGAKNTWNGAKSWASGTWNNIKAGFGNVAGWFKTTFTNAWNNVKNVFSSGGKIFNGIKDGILKGLKTVINALISGINKVIATPFNGLNTALNKIKSISILGKKPFSGISTIKVPQIPKLAQGGWFDANNPQLAIVGDNKREPEIVAPESKIEEAVMRGLARSGNANSNSKLDLEILVKYEDGRRIIKKINDYQIQQGKVLLMT